MFLLAIIGGPLTIMFAGAIALGWLVWRIWGRTRSVGAIAALDWTALLAPGLLFLAASLAIWLLYRKIKSAADGLAALAKSVGVIEEWLSTPLEERLRQLEQSDADLHANVQAHQSVIDELSSLRTRVHRLEIHTGTDPMFQPLMKRHPQGEESQFPPGSIGALLGLSELKAS